ncbi:MAG: hypothetical protein O7D91_00385 [Planctomycetota bacterium]|nr:hypothetical protein [Planctomycetota bacterium]
MMSTQNRIVAWVAIGLLAAIVNGLSPNTEAHQNEGQREAAGAGDDYDLSWYTVDGGGGTSTGDGFILRGTIGQPDSGDLTGGGFVLRGGFWQPAACGDCPTDSDGSGNTGAFDLAILLGAWGPVTPDSDCLDADESGFIEAFDLAVLLGSWGTCL